MKSLYLSLAVVLFSINSFASDTPDIQTSISDDGQTAIYFLSRYCVDAFNEATKAGAWIGQTSYSGSWKDSGKPFTISYAMFKRSGFVNSKSAGTIELKATPFEAPVLDGPSFKFSCDYSR